MCWEKIGEDDNKKTNCLIGKSEKKHIFVSIKIFNLNHPDMKHAIVIILAFFIGFPSAVLGVNLSENTDKGNEGKTTNQIVVSPNPATEFVTLTVPSSFDFVLFSTNGKQIVSATDCSSVYKVDVSSLEAGIYILNIIIDDNIYMKKVVISKK